MNNRNALRLHAFISLALLSLSVHDCIQVRSDTSQCLCLRALRETFPLTVSALFVSPALQLGLHTTYLRSERHR